MKQLVIVPDDVDEASLRELMPQVINYLEARGLFFSNCWSEMMCSITRADLQTGLFPHDHGIKRIVKETTPGLSLSSRTMAHAAETENTAYIGKLHTANEATGGKSAPNLMGWSYWAGHMENLDWRGEPWNGQHVWPRVENGVEVPCHVYSTTQIVNDFLAFQAGKDDYLAIVAFAAAHTPLNRPPGYESVLPSDLPSPEDDETDWWRVMIEHMGQEIMRMINSMDTPEDVEIYLFSDNGAPAMHGGAKGSPWENGINVPLWIAGPDVQQGVVSNPCMVADIYATVTGEETTRSRSMRGYFDDTQIGSHREFSFAEKVKPNGDFVRACRGPRYKIVRFQGEGWQLYDLLNDPAELVDLRSTGVPLTEDEQEAFDAMKLAWLEILRS